MQLHCRQGTLLRPQAECQVAADTCPICMQNLHLRCAADSNRILIIAEQGHLDLDMAAVGSDCSVYLREGSVTKLSPGSKRPPWLEQNVCLVLV
jgi:hypothetical protein